MKVTQTMEEDKMQKPLNIRYCQPSAYEIYYEGGGELPEKLQGKYTDKRTAQLAIDLYLKTRVSRNRKTADAS